MWKPEHRATADRRGLRYESDLTDAEWALVSGIAASLRRWTRGNGWWSSRTSIVSPRPARWPPVSRTKSINRWAQSNNTETAKIMLKSQSPDLKQIEEI